MGLCCHAFEQPYITGLLRFSAFCRFRHLLPQIGRLDGNWIDGTRKLK
jgi:hypothetical protein